MRILVIGQGGREHAIAWHAAKTAEQVFVAPGNAGTAREENVSNIDIQVDDIEALIEFAQKNTIDLTIVGPELPLTLGIVDAFKQAHLNCFGPSQACAELEGSKVFAKSFMQQYNIPTASYASFSDQAKALAYLQTQSYPLVIKADGLAAGKGVIIAHTAEHAQATVEAMLSGEAFKQAGKTIVIESFLTGQEASFIALCDGEHVLPLASSQDHKARDDGDQGPNTGGMGAYSPAPIITPELEQRILEQAIYPVIHGMKERGTPYQGFLYAGLMIDEQHNFKVLEYNCRLGDPETQVLMMRLQGDLNALCLAACQGELDKHSCQWDPRPAVGVVMAAGGYPNQYRKGDVIQGLDTIHNPNQKIFHAGTQIHSDDVVTHGGRVLCACAWGNDFKAAQQHAYELANSIHWEDCYYRNDIAYRAI